MRFVGFANYAGVFHDDLFWKAVVNTAWFILLTVPAMNALSLLVALGLNTRLKGETVFKVLYYLPTVLSVAVVATLWRWLYSVDFGLINHYLGAGHALLHRMGLASAEWKPVPWLTNDHMAMPSLAITSIWWGLGGAMLIYLAGLRGIPDVYYEAAMLDGASGWARFRSVTWPLLKPTTLFNVVVGIIGASQMFGQAFMMPAAPSAPHWSTLTVVVYMYQTGFSLFKMGYGCAVGYAVFVLVLGLALVQFRLFAFRDELA